MKPGRTMEQHFRESAGARCISASLALAALATLASPLAHALVVSCTVSATAVAFGTYAPGQTSALTSSGTVNVNCIVASGRNPVTIALSKGSSGSFTPRTMASGLNTLSYNLYLDAAYSQIWGDGSGGSLTDNDSVNPGHPNINATVYGQIPPLLDPATGSYSDTITVTVSY
jgi:spore coat protein U-like protein